MDGLSAATSRRFGFSGGDEPTGETTTSEAWVNPEVLQLATIAPGPSANSGHNVARISDEYRQVHFVAEAHGGGRLSTDLRFEELDIDRIWLVLDAELHW